jgi:hypothetical protein
MRDPRRKLCFADERKRSMTESNRKSPTRRDVVGGIAGATIVAGAEISSRTAFAQQVNPAKGFHRIDRNLMITPAQAFEWNMFKAEGGPTYAGSASWKRFTDFLIARMEEFGAVDLDYVEIPYDHYIVEDWPDRSTHAASSANAVERLVTDGTPVGVVASYGMTSGSTPPEGLTAPMLYYDVANPPPKERIAGKILVFETAPYPAPPYSESFLDNFTLTDYEWRSPGKWAPLFEPVPTNITTSYHCRWVWSQLNRFATTAIAGKATGVVIVYDLSPGAALGLTQRSVYTNDAKAGLGANYINCPTLTLDRVNGAKVLADAKAGKTATLTLRARFQRDVDKAIIGYLPGRNYGTPRDEQILLATHTDAMSLIEENGGIGMIGILSYFNKLPRAARDRTLVFYFDCRHFMPGGENSWPQFDYYTLHPDRLKPIVATVGMEHMGGRQTIETGPGGNTYAYSSERPEDGGVITSLMDVFNNNIWLVETIARAATDNNWPRVDVKSGGVAPGVNGGFQGRVKSPMNKGRVYGLPGLGLAGDWPGGWTQTFAQIDTEAGPNGFDPDYFVQQVAGLSQITGDLMKVKPAVINLSWGKLNSAIVKMKDTAFRESAEGAAMRKALLDRYVDAFRRIEQGDVAGARTNLKELAAAVSKVAASGEAAAVVKNLDETLSKIS